MTVVPSNRERVLWPEAGFTKGAMLDYYAAVAGAIVPHLRDRPLTMRRFPEGVEQEGWYQYECRGAPDWLRTVQIPYADGSRRRFCVVDDDRGLLWVANLGTIELHTHLHRVDALEEPSYVVFDLDPGQPADLADCCRVALRVRDELAANGLAAFPKTSGSVGLHLYVPLNRGEAYAATKAFARRLAHRLAHELPDEVVAGNARGARRGKVLVDWLQNDASRSMIAPYSLRAMPWPTVSLPVTWDEVQHAASTGRADLLTFTADDVARRLELHDDLFASVLTLEQPLPPA
ncbi:MAG TPA: non-homologous end-joining DNA ligase [Gaiellaceae bacterium]|nr:non-homologous end-joining DNA ligase [Gaiellaceae bacterium]